MLSEDLAERLVEHLDILREDLLPTVVVELEHLGLIVVEIKEPEKEKIEKDNGIINI